MHDCGRKWRCESSSLLLFVWYMLRIYYRKYRTGRVAGMTVFFFFIFIFRWSDITTYDFLCNKFNIYLTCWKSCPFFRVYFSKCGCHLFCLPLNILCSKEKYRKIKYCANFCFSWIYCFTPSRLLRLRNCVPLQFSLLKIRVVQFWFALNLIDYFSNKVFYEIWLARSGKLCKRKTCLHWNYKLENHLFSSLKLVGL